MNRFSGYRELLGCGLRAIEIVNDSYVVLRLPPKHCCDMDGAIKLAKFVQPDVDYIVTYSGDLRDTRYVLKENGWIAFR